jgi:hypothetical protein
VTVAQNTLAGPISPRRVVAIERPRRNAAAVDGEPLWLANRSWPVEGETEVWNSILDVRAASAGQGKNGS